MQVQSTQLVQGLISTPSDPVIPAVPGEFYNYSETFTTQRPLFYQCKCKSQKGRSIDEVEILAHDGHAIDLVFVFAGGRVSLCSPNAAQSIALLDGHVSPDVLPHTIITSASITKHSFDGVRMQKDVRRLTQLCRQESARKLTSIVLSPGMILTTATKSGKYGLLRVTELTPSSVKVDACHILL